MAPYFVHTFNMALYHKWDVKNDFAYVLQFFSLISDSLGSVYLILSTLYWLKRYKIPSVPFDAFWTFEVHCYYKISYQLYIDSKK